ncbi:MAG: type I methionyl aminopeptidase [Myxococcota bacterium]|nr:type I methionyl aminopeptidase [Myxococcota bacterium]
MSYGERIAIKSRRELDRMREAGRHTGEILLVLREAARPGVRTDELNEIASKELEKRGLRSPFLGYSPGGLPPYPAVLCVSINDEIVHGIPGSRELQEGDILSLDFGVDFEGFHGDSAVTIPIGSVPGETRQLVKTTRDSLYEGIAKMVPGQRLSDIGHAVQSKAERSGYSVVRQFVGHGIGREMHEPPQVPNYGRKGRGPRLTAGMVFAIEPMVNVGTEEVRMLEDEWTAVTADGALSAHFEHTVAITDEGPEVLTAVQGSH